MEKKQTVVLALGHRALGETLPEQKQAARIAAASIVDLVELGVNVVITHSNTQQVGMIHMAMNEFARNHPEYTSCPMSVASAMSQGYVGYDLQNAIRSELKARKIDKPVSSVLSQVLVDPYDEAFYQPSKVIGRVLTEEEASLEEKKGNKVVQTEEGYRRIVASPRPREIIELRTIKTLLKDDQIVICCGGGGIPVLERGDDLRGAPAVVEKDRVAGLLAIDLNADVLMMLTSFNHIPLHDGDVEEQGLSGRISPRRLRMLMEQRAVEDEALKLKLESVLDFVELGHRRRGLISTIDQAKAAFLGEGGCEITE